MPRPEGALNVQLINGRAETQDNSKVWRPLAVGSSSVSISSGLRTGTGRAVLANKSGGQILVGSASQLRVYSQETDFQSGQFLMDGPVGAFALGSHLVLDDKGRARIDLTTDGSTQRIAVIRGTLRLSNGAKTVMVGSGQQINLKTLLVNPFKEDDPWYTAQFVGPGDAKLEASRGDVTVTLENAAAQAAQIGTVLPQGATVNSGSGAWAEIGFIGGGYLRLAEQSELRVLAIEKTARGREVTLQLTKGSAWNVVQKGQGGYKISTPVVSTAVRGTKFRVDANGLVKVMEGQVALPSDNGASVSAGQQKQQGKATVPLQLDELDRFNQALDAERAKPMTLEVKSQGSRTQNLALKVATLPDTLVLAQVQPAGGAGIPLKVTGDPTVGNFSVISANTLPEGIYRLQVRAERFGHQRQWSAPLIIDRTPPTISDTQAQIEGRILTITGIAGDTPSISPTAQVPATKGMSDRLILTVKVGTETFTRAVNGAFKIQLPAPPKNVPIDLDLRDAAGNVSHVRIP